MNLAVGRGSDDKHRELAKDRHTQVSPPTHNLLAYERSPCKGDHSQAPVPVNKFWGSCRLRTDSVSPVLFLGLTRSLNAFLLPRGLCFVSCFNRV